jgi:drug/metabolite transporter (DMT)-like permease
MKAIEKAAIYMVYSSFFLALVNFSVKGCVGPLGVVESTFFRYFAPLVLLIPILTWKKTWHKLRPQVSFWMHFLRGIFAVLGQFSLNYYLTQATLVNATMLWATGPIFVPIIMHFFYKQKTPLVTWISIIICLLGVALMVKPTHGIFDPFCIWGLMAGLSTAFSQILWGQNIEKGSITENLFYLYIFASGLSLIAWLFLGDEVKAVLPNTTLLWAALVGMGLASLGNQLFRSKAYQRAPSYLLTPILYVAVLGAGILDIVFYHNWPDVWGYAGFVLVCIGTLLKWWYLKKHYRDRYNAS